VESRTEEHHERELFGFATISDLLFALHHEDYRLTAHAAEVMSGVFLAHYLGWFGEQVVLEHGGFVTKYQDCSAQPVMPYPRPHMYPLCGLVLAAVEAQQLLMIDCSAMAHSLLVLRYHLHSGTLVFDVVPKIA
jgi:hypothetical protein